MAATCSGASLLPAARPNESPAEPRNSFLRKLQFGADYYPEDWPEERLEIDARLMRQAGFLTVRLADTNWERLEPAEGQYSFAWLDNALQILSRHGIRSILCTSSYAPPAWMIQKHPEFYLVNEEGARHRWGGMGFMCLNNPIYRQYVAKLVSALSSRYGHNSNVIGWQIDNEMEPARSACYDEQFCQPRFREYLESKFGNLDELNRRLFTQSYGHTYSSWDQIVLPYSLAEQMVQVPLILESKRFFSKNIVDFIAFQARLLRQNTSEQFITHNTYSVEMNCFDVARTLDFISEDCYPHVGQYQQPAFTADLMRGFNHGKSFLDLEVRSGTAGPYSLIDATPPPGLIRLWVWQTVAHGSNGLLFFRWRRNNGGSEQYWQGLLNFDGSPTSALKEATTVGEELARIGPKLIGGHSPAEIAAIFSYDSLWALQIGDRKFPYQEQLACLSNAFRRLALNVDVVEPSNDLQGYKLVIAPSLHVVNSEIQHKLQAFVKSGGILILTPRSGFKNQDNLATWVPPGPLQDLAQVSVSNYTLLQKSSADRWLDFPEENNSYRASPDNMIQSVSPDWSANYQAQGWADILELRGAQPLFVYTKDYYAGRPAITQASYGKGKVFYVGTFLESQFYIDLAQRACRWANIQSGPKIPAGMDFALRQKGSLALRFLLNFSSSPITVEFPGRHEELISAKFLNDRCIVPALDVAVLRQA